MVSTHADISNSVIAIHFLCPYLEICRCELSVELFVKSKGVCHQTEKKVDK